MLNDEDLELEGNTRLKQQRISLNETVPTQNAVYSPMATPEKTGKVTKHRNEQKKIQGKSKLESSKVAAVTKNLSQDLQMIESHKIKHKANSLANKQVQAEYNRISRKR